MPKILISSIRSNEVHEIEGLILGKESKNLIQMKIENCIMHIIIGYVFI